nr:MAG TPA: hypothetical protein [Caudoviricetes sp.]
MRRSFLFIYMHNCGTAFKLCRFYFIAISVIFVKKCKHPGTCFFRVPGHFYIKPYT